MFLGHLTDKISMNILSHKVNVGKRLERSERSERPAGEARGGLRGLSSARGERAAFKSGATDMGPSLISSKTGKKNSKFVFDHSNLGGINEHSSSFVLISS